MPPQTRKPYQYKYNHQEWQDELDLNVTAMDFRQYDNALGRFHTMDRLTELAPGITPYRFGFNNPNYWSDPTGLFENIFQALSYMFQNNIEGTIGSTGGYGSLYYIYSGTGIDAKSIFMIGGELHISGPIIQAITVEDTGGGPSNSGGGPNKPINSGGLYGGSTFFGANGFLGGNNWNNINNNVVPVTNGVSGIFENAARYVNKGTNTAADVAYNLKVIKVAGRVSMAGNISIIGSSVVTLIDNPTWGNVTRVLLQSGIIGTEIWLNSVAPGLGVLVGTVLSALEAEYGQQLYNHIDGK